jgi:hypothetical protein
MLDSSQLLANSPSSSSSSERRLKIKSQSLSQANNFSAYLFRVSQILADEVPNHYHDDIAQALARLKQTLTSIDVRQLKCAALSQGVWDCFPTTDPIINKMISLAAIKSHHRVLEPSAGAGDLCQAIAQAGAGYLDCFEIHPLLQQALKLQGFNLIGDDFLSCSPLPKKRSHRC